MLTPEEKRAAACVIGAFVLGLGTMFYRAKHPRPVSPPAAKEQQEAKRSASRARSARGAPTPLRSPAAPDSGQAATDRGDEDEE